jgi:hypothetical protein
MEGPGQAKVARRGVGQQGTPRGAKDGGSPVRPMTPYHDDLNSGAACEYTSQSSKSHLMALHVKASTALSGAAPSSYSSRSARRPRSPDHRDIEMRYFLFICKSTYPRTVRTTKCIDRCTLPNQTITSPIFWRKHPWRAPAIPRRRSPSSPPPPAQRCAESCHLSIL